MSDEARVDEDEFTVVFRDDKQRHSTLQRVPGEAAQPGLPEVAHLIQPDGMVIPLRDDVRPLDNLLVNLIQLKLLKLLAFVCIRRVDIVTQQPKELMNVLS